MPNESSGQIFPGRREVKLEDVFLFADMLIEARERLHKTKAEIARDIEVEHSNIMRWENAESFPEYPIRKKVAQAYSINFKEFSRVLAISKEARELEKRLNVRREPPRKSKE